MRTLLRCVLATTTLLVVCALSRGIAETPQDDLIDNPHYKGWAGFKPGTKVVLKEHTVFGEGATEEKTVEYKLLAVTPDKVTVATAVVEKELLSFVESAPAKITYPAKVSKAD